MKKLILGLAMFACLAPLSSYAAYNTDCLSVKERGSRNNPQWVVQNRCGHGFVVVVRSGGYEETLSLTADEQSHLFDRRVEIISSCDARKRDCRERNRDRRQDRDYDRNYDRDRDWDRQRERERYR